MNRIIVLCPANFASGGPELLHQLCHSLNNSAFNAYMCYYSYDKSTYESPVSSVYSNYNNPYLILDEYSEKENDIVVVPEVFPSYLYMTTFKARILFWWLSVDNFYNSEPCFIPRLFRQFNMDSDFIWKNFNNNRKKISILKKNDSIIHLVQSHYAYNHCTKVLGIDENNVKYLSDYLNPYFIENAIKKGNNERQNIVLYNPKKGLKYTKQLIQKSNGTIKWIPLINLTKEEMSNLLSIAKVYIDFGNHPGKDRIPREAAISGCCIITNKKGSARYQEDVPIPNTYKFEHLEDNIDQILNKITYIFNNFKKCSSEFESYRKFIQHEKESFDEDAKEIFSKLV